MEERKPRELIIVKPEKCVGCNACIRTCPAPEANITKTIKDDSGKVIKSVTTVNPEKCIACGECVRNCSHGARDYVDDTTEAMDAVMRSKERFIVIVAPAIKTVFPTTWKTILEWFRRHNCLIFDVSRGADICTWAHLRAIQSGRVKNVVTQPCAAIVKYVEVYQPALLRNLSPIHSPMLCEVAYIRKYLHYEERIIALSPCVAKKNEFMETGMVDFNVTFKKLMEYFGKVGVPIHEDFAEDFRFDFEDAQGQLGAIYPRIGGLRDNLWMHDPDINITTSEGVGKVYRELNEYATLSESKKPEVFDVLSCEFGCNVGAGTGQTRTIFDIGETMREVEKEAKSRRKTTGGFFRGAEDKLFKQFDELLNIKDFMRDYKTGIPSYVPSDAELDEVFESMGKHTEEDRHYNCHACGYTSCKEMATAIFRGLNTPDNCIVHAKSVLMEHHTELTAKHSDLSEIAESCKGISEQMQKDMERITGSMGVIRNANKSTTERADAVKSLLQNVVAFCEGSKNMNESDMQTLVGILKTTLDAFKNLYDDLKTSTGSTLSVDSNILKLNDLVREINASLEKAG